MSIQRLIHLAGFGLASALALTLASCGDAKNTDPSTQGAGTTTASLDAAAAEKPDPARALERSAARWDHKVAGDWIQVYDFVLPELRRGQSLGRFLTDKEHHHYEKPSKPRLLGVRDRLAFVEVTALWTPTHPMVVSANNLNSLEELRQELTVVETWAAARGEWYWTREERPNDFFEANPDIIPGAAGTR